MCRAVCLSVCFAFLPYIHPPPTHPPPNQTAAASAFPPRFSTRGSLLLSHSALSFAVLLPCVYMSRLVGGWAGGWRRENAYLSLALVRSFFSFSPPPPLPPPPRPPPSRRTGGPPSPVYSLLVGCEEEEVGGGRGGACCCWCCCPLPPPPPLPLPPLPPRSSQRRFRSSCLLCVREYGHTRKSK